MKQNRQKIVRLQQDNKDLYKLKADKLKVSYISTELLHTVHYWSAESLYFLCICSLCIFVNDKQFNRLYMLQQNCKIISHGILPVV